MVHLRDAFSWPLATTYSGRVGCDTSDRDVRVHFLPENEISLRATPQFNMSVAHNSKQDSMETRNVSSNRQMREETRRCRLSETEHGRSAQELTMLGKDWCSVDDNPNGHRPNHWTCTSRFSSEYTTATLDHANALASVDRSVSGYFKVHHMCTLNGTLATVSREKSALNAGLVAAYVPERPRMATPFGDALFSRPKARANNGRVGRRRMN